MAINISTMVCTILKKTVIKAAAPAPVTVVNSNRQAPSLTPIPAGLNRASSPRVPAKTVTETMNGNIVIAKGAKAFIMHQVAIPAQSHWANTNPKLVTI